MNLLSHDPDYALDPFLVPPPIVEFFDRVKREHEPALAPLRERRRALREQQRLADEAKRRLLAEEQARTGPPDEGRPRRRSGSTCSTGCRSAPGSSRTAIARRAPRSPPGRSSLGLVNIGAILFHNQLAEDRTRTCISGQPGCSRPPYSDSDRDLSRTRRRGEVRVGRRCSGRSTRYGVWDAHRHFVPIVETEIAPGGERRLAQARVGLLGRRRPWRRSS